MNSRERWLLEQLKNYRVLRSDMEFLERRIKTMSYKMTANYGPMCGSGGFGGSKVESHSLRLASLKQELDAKKRVVELLQDAMNNSGLNKRERSLVVATVNGLSLSEYARRENIYRSHVYKIRDGAIKKMVRRMEKDTK